MKRHHRYSNSNTANAHIQGRGEQKEEVSSNGNASMFKRDKKQKKKNRRQNASSSSKSSSTAPTNLDAGSMDDILAQLQRQREKKKKAEVNINAKVTATITTETHSLDGCNEEYQHQQQNNNNASTRNEHENVGGNFQYDPVTKRYLPKSAFRSNGNNDMCIQRIQHKQRVLELDSDNNNIISNNKKKRINSNQPETGAFFGVEHNSMFGLCGAVSNVDVTRVVFRGTRFLPTPKCLGDKASLNVHVHASKTSRKKKNRMKHYKHQHHSNLHPEDHTNTVPSKNDIAIPCTTRTTLLLKTALEYCSSASRRNAIVSMLGPRSVIAGRAKVVPAQSTLDKMQTDTDAPIEYNDDLHHAILYDDDDCDEETSECEKFDRALRPFCLGQGDQQQGLHEEHTNTMMHDTSSLSSSSLRNNIWYSMLHPLNRSRESQLRYQSPWSPNDVPYDCKCKSYLNPIVPTFDVLPGHSHGSITSLPYIATISNDKIFYRTPGRVKGRSAWELKRRSRSLRYHGVRFAPHKAANGNSLVGCTTHEGKGDEHAFTLQKTGTSFHQALEVVESYSLAFPVNDFCFSPDTADSGLVAFAHESDNSYSGASFFDLRSSSFSIRDNWLKSELLCLEFRKNEGNSNQVLFGHRNGCVSMIDTRSRRDVSFATCTGLPGISFGSATSIQQLEHDNNLVAVKGSFGSCRIFDLRRLCNSNSRSSSRHHQSTLMELSLPDSLVHPTKSVRCTGMAIDPSGKILVAPFTSVHDGVYFAMWDICSGSLLRTMNLSQSNLSTRSETGNSSDEAAAFCELSSVVTAGYEMFCQKGSNRPMISSSSWGLWYKTLTLSDTSPSSWGGGIHHIRF